MATIEEMKARLDKLKGTKFALSPAVDEESSIADEIVKHERRIDEEGWAALKKLATMHEARVIASMTEEQRSKTMVRCVYDWPTHRRTMKGDDIETGRGIVVVTAPEGQVAAKAFRKRNRMASGSADFVDMDPAAVNEALMKVTKYPALDVLQVMLIESEPLCQAAYQASMSLSGVLARELTGKSES